MVTVEINKNVFRKISYGLYVVASNDGDLKSGCIVNTVSQITSENPIIAVSLNKNNYTNFIAKKKKKLSISILSNQVNNEFIKTFGFASSKDTDKFKNINYEYIDDVVVVKDYASSYLVGEVINIIDCETHDIFLVRVLASEVLNDDKSITYLDYQTKLKGSTSTKAPTYIEPEVNNSDSYKYRCIICGHIYDEAVEKVKFNDLPDDWVCPKCGVGKDKFERIN